MAEASLGPLDRRIRFERKIAVAGLMSAGLSGWQEVATVWASLQDQLPSQSEATTDGVQVATRPTRIRLRYRAGVTSDMRIVIDPGLATERIAQIIAGPAELGRRRGLELMAAAFSTAGNPA